MKRMAMAAMAGLAIISAASCSESQEKKPATHKNNTPAAKVEAPLPNYRYVDLDTILSKYNLAKDYNEEMLRMQSSMESQVRSHESRLQKKATEMQNKLQNNGYLSEASYEQDQKTIASMQNEAQRSVASLQSNFEQSAMHAQKTVNDSIQAFIEDYNAKHGYDAILFKAATLYINPALDITNEVVEGLNARYNKVKK